MAASEVGIGIVGYGAMGRAHSYGYTVAPCLRSLPYRPALRVISGRHRDLAEVVARSYGIERVTDDWRAVVSAADVQIVHVCTPPGTHAEIVAAAAANGKAVVCEKPLAASLASARVAADSVRSAGVRSLIGFNYRRLPALSLMKQLVDEGRIGELRLWRGTWLSDEFLDPEIPFDWRFERAQGASTIADLGAHLLDLAGWMGGPVVSVAAQSATFTRARRDRDDGGTLRTVDNDDASSALLQFASGATGVFETAKVAPGRPCDFVVELNGSRGTLRFDYSRLNELWFADATEPDDVRGMRRIRAELPSHPETEGWWPVGQGIGYGASFVNQASYVLAEWAAGAWTPDLETGLAVQVVAEAIEVAAARRCWVDVDEVARGAPG